MKSEKSLWVAFVLCSIFGSLGIHRFYVGKNKSGFLMLITLGGLGFWMLWDLLMILLGQFTDDQELKLSWTTPSLVIIFLINMVGLGFLISFGKTVQLSSIEQCKELSARIDGLQDPELGSILRDQIKSRLDILKIEAARTSFFEIKKAGILFLFVDLLSLQLQDGKLTSAESNEWIETFDNRKSLRHDTFKKMVDSRRFQPSI